MPSVTIKRVLLRMLALAALCVMLGCSDAQLKDMPGKYALKAEWGESTLLLRSDHTMEQAVRTTKGASRQISGTWQFANSIVTLKPCLEVRLKTEGTPADGCASGVTVTPFGKIEISMDSDYNVAYEKIKGVESGDSRRRSSPLLAR